MEEPTTKEKPLKEMHLTIAEQFDVFKQGDNILFDFGDSLSLVKYEGGKLDILPANTHSYAKNVRIKALSGEMLDYLTGSGPKPKAKPPHERVVNKLQAEIYSTHMLEFSFDPEFDLYLPHAQKTDIFVQLAKEMADRTIIRHYPGLKIFAEDNLIKERMREIVRPNYFESVIIPFIESQPTKFEIPYRGFKFREWRAWLKSVVGKSWRSEFCKIVKDLSFGAFCYVGCKEEVYCLGLPKTEHGVFMQGTYLTSTKPMLYFSNNYLGDLSARDKRPLFRGKGPVNVARYRTYNPPDFNGEYFVFPQIGRSQDCKNTIFTGRPTLITGDIEEALDHFSTTDFSEFDDIVKRYAKTVDKVHPETEKMRNGKYFF